jgi:hypothetical protein
MPLIPIEQQLTDHRFHKLRLIATDMDGTLTHRGKFTASLLQAFEDLIAADIPVLIVTGRSAGLMQVLAKYFPEYTAEQVLTVGDSPNDTSLFNPELFPLSVGVANVWDYAQELIYQPAYVTKAREGEGFCELVRYVTGC